VVRGNQVVAHAIPQVAPFIADDVGMALKPLALCLTLAMCLGVGAAATRKHHPLTGAIGSQEPMQPMVGQPFLAPTAGGSLVSHGQFLYVLLGSKVYKLDPKDLRVLSVRSLTGSVSTVPTVAKKRTRRHPKQDSDSD
jgi:hypothetical protein